jgi:diguanylate cyclase (GGDEF)-like protein
MRTDEVSFHFPSPNSDHETTAKTLNDSVSLNIPIEIEYDDHYQALRDATVMMVDDEPTTIEVIQALLETEGYRRFVTTAQSNRAMDLLASENPDAVLLDLHMPEVTGFDILAFARRDSRYRHIPIIVLTSSNDSETKLRALQLGATDFLAKPVDPSELALRLRNTLAAKAYQDRLTYYDTLTGLPNRRMFMDRLIWSLRCAKRDGTGGAVLHIDLDYFQKINDTLGHAVGDRLLIGIGQRLLQCVPGVDTGSATDGNESQAILARVGGDEFNVLLPEMARIENAALMAGNILAAMKEPFEVDGHEVFITPSIGVAVFPSDGEASDTLLKHAGVAMNQAKQHGRNTYEFYSTKMNAKALERLSLENQLRRALAREELLLVYQPKIDIRTGRVVGAEALLRWNHPEQGLISPISFIPLAEQTGLIVSFGEWVLHTACRQNKAWQSAGLPNIHIAVNVSARQFRDVRFIRTISEVLEDSGLEPQYLTLELTENTIMENTKENLDTLHRIKTMGVKLSVDDFGTGYSSLSYLKQLPLDELKIDRSFISEIRSEADDAPIVTAIIAMAHSLGLTVVMEGIETEQQLVFARDRSCDEYQGYLFSKPVTSRQFETMVAAGTRA